MAPEVLKGAYCKQADLWSVGVMAYMLLSSQMPFFGRKRSEIVAQIMEGHVEFKGRRWKRVSRQGKAFLKELLVVDPNERATAEEALQCQWLNRYYNMTIRNIEPDSSSIELSNVEDSMSRFVNYSKLRKVALMVIAHKSTSNEIGILRKIFQRYDTLRTGQVKYEQFKTAVSQAGFSEEATRQIFEALVGIKISSSICCCIHSSLYSYMFVVHCFQ
jgi:calcium-dependent protein kinase